MLFQFRPGYDWLYKFRCGYDRIFQALSAYFSIGLFSSG